MSEFYNEAIKNRYLESIENEGSRITNKYIFIASKDAEEKLGMDLYNFPLEYIEKVMEEINPKTSNTARSNMSYIKNYISWCIENGYRENNINPLSGIDRTWYSKFVDRVAKIHFSDDELEDLIEEFDNAQDQAMVQLWFEGIQGRQHSEIKELNYYDINWNTNELNLKDLDGSRRTVKVSDKCMRYLENAHKQEIYRFYYESDRSKEMPLCYSNFIFRNVFSHKTKDKEVSTNVIYTRLNIIKRKFNLEFFTPNGIKQSGMIYTAAKIYKRDGYFGDNGNYKQWEEIGDKYNWVKINEGAQYNTRLMKEFITTKNLKDLYDIDVEITIRERMKKQK